MTSRTPSPSLPLPPRSPSRSPAPSPSRSPAPSPSTPPSAVPETCAVPRFAPVRVRGGRYAWARGVRRGRRAVAAGLAMTAAALAASGLREPAPEVGPEARRAVGAVTVAGGPPGAAEKPARPAPEVVSAPVRIADGATVRLLRPGDRVDVIAAPHTPAGSSAEGGGPPARVVVSGARVAAVPGAESADGAGHPHHRAGGYPGLPEGEGDPPDGVDAFDGTGQSGGALLVLAVPRAAAPGLVAASATSRLAVVLC
ncbi:hypothetical protein CP974_12295 [Streptomyces fradiae ATCC 10745 = DSM 40063]|nr:hypothetical protein CP974_12295 [Streptomyces fradiae ATCC 10745 = DSM 40063]